MRTLIRYTSIIALCLASVAFAQSPAPGSDDGDTSSKIITQTLTPVFNDDATLAATAEPREPAIPYSLSTILSKGADGQGLTMEEKWSKDVMVCDRVQMTGTRHKRTVCHSRAEWQAMRTHGRELADPRRRAAAP